MENVDPNQEVISSRFSLVSYFSEDQDTGADQNFEMRLLPERSPADFNRLSPTTSPLKTAPELSENDVKYGKQYPRRVSVTDTSYNSPCTSKLAAVVRSLREEDLPRSQESACNKQGISTVK